MLPPETCRRQSPIRNLSSYSNIISTPLRRGRDDLDSGLGTDSDSTTSSDEDDAQDPSAAWPDLHEKVHSTIAELGGKVLPKLNWSAPKDATWMLPTNDMECRTANDVYLLLKSSDFVTHDLEHVFDDCVEGSESESEEESEEESAATAADGSGLKDVAPTGKFHSIPYVLVLRKSFRLNPSLEFRCFVREMSLIAISQREMNHFPFLAELQPKLQQEILTFLENHLPDLADYFAPARLAKAPTTTKAGEVEDPAEKRKAQQQEQGARPSFVLDVYIPPPHDRVWLIDINPWAPRTDSLLFSWTELLDPAFPHDLSSSSLPQIDRRRYSSSPSSSPSSLEHSSPITQNTHAIIETPSLLSTSSSGSPVITAAATTSQPPAFRLITACDPEAYQFSSTKYSAHKLPKDVVDAAAVMGESAHSAIGGSSNGSSDSGRGGVSELMKHWNRALEKMEQEKSEEEDGDGDDDDDNKD